ncbi:MAG: VTT domain-containing protein [Chrysiogenetes bacterium]|nr:VTT domain-containing protein [Chrysiogenetes bacterium]
MVDSAFEFFSQLDGFALYLAIYATLVANSVGLPIPEEVVLVIAGYLSGGQEAILNPYIAAAFGMLGILTGDSAIFGIARRYGEDILDFKPVRKIFHKKRMERASHYFEKYGAKVVFVARFISGARAPVYLIAGILRMPYRKFLALDAIAACIGIPLWIWLGHTAAGNVHELTRRVQTSKQHLTVILVIVIVAVVLYQAYTFITKSLSEKAVREYEKEHPDALLKDHILPEHVRGLEEPHHRGEKMSIFKAYDIRGVVPTQLDAELARRIGWSIGTFLEVEQVVVGRDVRASADEITDALCRGLGQAGVKVLDIGRGTTPLTNFANGVRGAGGSVMVTASHNPPEYNGFKISRANAVPVYDKEITRIGELCDEAPEDDGSSPERIATDVRVEFIDRVVARAETGGKRLKVVADLSSGAATVLSPEIFEKLPHDFVLLNAEPDGTFPSHPPDPLEEENLEQCRKAILAEGADLGAVYDGDADRVVFLDEKGETLTGDLATLLMALDLIGMSDDEKPVCFYDVRSSRMVPEKLREAGADPRQCRVGHAFIKTAMREAGGLCAGELSGHYYFRDNFYAENSDLALVLLLNLLGKQGKALSEVAAPYRAYFPSGEINMQVADKAAAIEKISQHYQEGKQSRLDGLTVEFPDWWFNLRASNTEPLLRLNLESTASREDMERHRDEILALIGH